MNHPAKTEDKCEAVTVEATENNRPETLHTNQKLFVQALLREGVYVQLIEKESELIYCEHNGRSEFIFDRYNSLISHTLTTLCSDKYLSKNILSSHKLSTPQGFLIDRKMPIESVIQQAMSLKFPVIIKPNRGSHGDGIIFDIASPGQLLHIRQQCVESGKYDATLIEEQVSGKEYRIFVTKTGHIACIYRENAYIIGDGVRTIAQLVVEENLKRQDRSKYAVYTIQIDHDYLAQQGLRDEHVPLEGQKIYVRHNSNIATGGVPHDVTDHMSEGFTTIAQKTLQAFAGGSYLGIDIMTEDIGGEPENSDYHIIEVNSNPSFSIHELPYTGTKQVVSEWVVEMMYNN